MNTRANLSLLFNKVISDATTQPPFINKRKKDHKEAFIIIGNLLSEISYLVQDRFMTDKEVYKFILNWYEIYMGFDCLESITLYFSCTGYINNMIDSYIKIAEITEEYEVLSNLTKFKDLKNQDNKTYF